MAVLHSNKAVHFLYLNHSGDRTVGISQRTAGSRSPTHPISITLTYPLRSLYRHGSKQFDGQHCKPQIIYNNAPQKRHMNVNNHRKPEIIYNNAPQKRHMNVNNHQFLYLNKKHHTHRKSADSNVKFSVQFN